MQPHSGKITLGRADGDAQEIVIAELLNELSEKGLWTHTRTYACVRVGLGGDWP